jgi:hypothetical protein
VTVEHIEVLVEEPSAEAALRAILPRVLGTTTFEIYQHSCKSELLKRLPERLRGYASWLPETWRILVLVDCDDDDCRKLKSDMESVAHQAGLATKSGVKNACFSVVNRIVIEELEAWYFGDWEAVLRAYPKVSVTIPNQAKYRLPDAIKGGTWEAFERILNQSGYYKSGLRKIEAARMVSEHMDPTRNTSPSFKALYTALVGMLG